MAKWNDNQARSASPMLTDGSLGKKNEHWANVH